MAAAMRRRLLHQLHPVLSHQAAVRRAPHCRLLHSPFPLPGTAASSPASPSLSPNLRPRSLLPTSAGAVVEAARTTAARAAGSLHELFSLQLSRTTSAGFTSASSTLLHGVAAPWAQCDWTTTQAHHMVLMLAGANVAVYGLWRMADPKFAFSSSMAWLDMYTGGRLHTLLTSALSHVNQRFMMNHFTVSVDNFQSLRWHTLLTSAFSHKDADHLLRNMFGFYFFGSTIARTFGPGFLLQLYVQGAVFGSAFYLAEKAFLATHKEGFGGWNTPALGASAAVNATILLYIFLYPTNILYLHFFIPLPAALVGAGLIGVDLWRVKKGQSRVSGSAHLGGAFVAVFVFAHIKGWI